jgi:hypothetical protein
MLCMQSPFGRQECNFGNIRHFQSASPLLSPGLGIIVAHILKPEPQPVSEPVPPEDAVEPEFQTPKERECWQLYRRMLEKGVSVSYDTVLRSVLPPRGAGDCVHLPQASTRFRANIPLIPSGQRFRTFLSHFTLYSLHHQRLGTPVSFLPSLPPSRF